MTKTLYQWQAEQVMEILAAVAKYPSSHYDRPSGFTTEKCTGCGKLATYTGLAHQEGFIKVEVRGFRDLRFAIWACSFECAARALQRLKGLSTKWPGA